MSLKYKYAKREEVPVEHQSFYVEREGVFCLDAEGATDKVKADEMRSHNVELRKKLEELEVRFNGIDPDQVRQLSAEKERLEEEQRLKEGKFQEVLETRLKNAKGEWDKERKTLTEDRDTLTSRLTAIQIDQGVTTAATKRGLRPTAIPDITSRARSVFRLVNGAPRAFEADGTTVRYGKDGVSPWGVSPSSEWVQTMLRLTGETASQTVCYATDGGVLQRLRRLLVCGPGSIEQAHRKDEWIALDQLHRGVELYERAFREWAC